MKFTRPLIIFSLTISFMPQGSRAADGPAFTRTQDVVYGRKVGTALTMDVFTPRKDANGLGVIFVVSGGWFSAPRGDQHAASSSRWSGGATPSSPWSTAASPGSRSPRSSRT